MAIESYEFDRFRLIPERYELQRSGRPVRLEKIPLDLLVLLVEHRDELISREMLTRLWTADTFVDFDHGLNNAVARIREVLEDSLGSPRYLETIPRRGYRFIAPITVVKASVVVALEAGPTIRPEDKTTNADGAADGMFLTRRIISCSGMDNVRGAMSFGNGFVRLRDVTRFSGSAGTATGDSVTEATTAASKPAAGSAAAPTTGISEARRGSSIIVTANADIAIAAPA